MTDEPTVLRDLRVLEVAVTGLVVTIDVYGGPTAVVASLCVPCPDARRRDDLAALAGGWRDAMTAVALSEVDGVGVLAVDASLQAGA